MVRRIASRAVLVWLVALAPTTVGAFQNESPGFEQLRFGQTIDDVRKAYPKVRQLDREELGATVVYSPYIDRYQVPEVHLSGLTQPVSFELRFWKQKLWVAIIYFGNNSTEDIVKLLTARYGSPTSTKPDPAWVGKVAVVATSSKQKWFSVSDRVAGKEISTLLIESLQHRRSAQSAGAPTQSAGANSATATPPTATK